MVNPYQKYQQQSVMTMTQGEMLNRLFDELVSQLSQAAIFIEKKDISSCNTALQKSQRIINYLRGTLNFDYPVSKNLDQLYDYFGRQIVSANVKKDASYLADILPLLTDLKDSFFQAERLARSQSAR